MSALMLAVQKGNLECVEQLAVNEELDWEIRDDEGRDIESLAR